MSFRAKFPLNLWTHQLEYFMTRKFFCLKALKKTCQKTVMSVTINLVIFMLWQECLWHRSNSGKTFKYFRKIQSRFDSLSDNATKIQREFQRGRLRLRLCFFLILKLLPHRNFSICNEFLQGKNPGIWTILGSEVFSHTYGISCLINCNIYLVYLSIPPLNLVRFLCPKSSMNVRRNDFQEIQNPFLLLKMSFRVG